MSLQIWVIYQKGPFFESKSKCFFLLDKLSISIWLWRPERLLFFGLLGRCPVSHLDVLRKRVFNIFSISGSTNGWKWRLVSAKRGENKYQPDDGLTTQKLTFFLYFGFTEFIHYFSKAQFCLWNTFLATFWYCLI